MEPHLERETEKLKRSWMQHDPEMLRDYLVAGVEDPRINVQSVLTRHSLIVALTGARFERLLEHELRFAIVLNWIAGLLKHSGSSYDAKALQHAIATGADSAEGI